MTSKNPKSHLSSKSKAVVNRAASKLIDQAVPTNVDVFEVAAYLKQYIESYRQYYKDFTSPKQGGGEYISLPVSPFLYSKEFLCFLANDGIVIADFSTHYVLQHDINGTPPLFLVQDHLWTELPVGSKVAESKTVEDIVISVHACHVTLASLIHSITFNFLAHISNEVLIPDMNSNFWTSMILSNFNFKNISGNRSRFINYLQVLRHRDKRAWDIRNIHYRVQVDIRRDYTNAISRIQRGLSYGFVSLWDEKIGSDPDFQNRLAIFKKAINQFEALLAESNNADESVFHDFLKNNSILLDVYGESISKPRFTYPVGASALGKSYVEPDFIIRYLGNSYRLVELEKPAKRIATQQGQPRSEVNQAAFQIGEWRQYIQHHYHLIKDQFPDISNTSPGMIIISRTTSESYGLGRNIEEYRSLLRNLYPNIEVLSYDDLVMKAKQAYIRLSSLV